MRVERSSGRSLRIIASATWVAIFLIFNSPSAQAQASLAAENIIPQVDVKQGTVAGPITTHYTVVRDARNENQWYYVPTEPRLVEISKPNGIEPEFSLLRYASRDPNNVLIFNGGGIVEFAVSLAAPDEVLPQLRTQIEALLKKNGKSTDGILIGALPFKSAEALIYSPAGELLGSTPLGTGIAPTFVTQKMVFSIPLTALGTDVYQALTTGNTGIPVAIRFKYNGLTPAVGFSVDVDWHQAYDYYSKNEEFRAQASYYGLFGASAAYSSQTIREKLEQAKAIKINVTEGEGFDITQIDKYLQPILKRINDEILQDFQPPPKIDPAVAPATGGGGGWFASGSYSVAVKNVSIVKQSTETIDFNYSKVIERETVASGLIGISQYKPEVQKHLITVVDSTIWEESILPLPPVPSSVDKLNMNIRLVSGVKGYDNQNYSWSKTVGWQDSKSKNIDRVGFSLLQIKGDLGDQGVKDATYNINYVVQANGDSLSYSDQFGVTENGGSIVSPKRFLDVVTIDPSGLVWDQTKPSPVRRVVVSLKAGDQDYSYTFRPAMIDKSTIDPSPTSWVIKRPVGILLPKISGAVEYRVGDISTKWTFEDLRSLSPSLNIFLDEQISKAK